MLGRSLRQVFGNARYALLAAAIGFATFVLVVWLPNLGLIWQIATSNSVRLVDKLAILMAFSGSIATNFTPFTGSATIAMAALFGMNAALIVYYYRFRRNPADRGGIGATVSLGGFLSGIFGIGCAACGTLALSPLLAFAGAGTLMTVLPFGGGEFAALGVAALAASLMLNVRAIGHLTVCRAPFEQGAMVDPASHAG